jgi:hypothetical protein
MAQVAAILLRDAKAREGRRKIAATAAIAGPDRLPSDRPLEGHGRNSIRPTLTAPGQTMAVPDSSRLPYPACGLKEGSVQRPGA